MTFSFGYAIILALLEMIANDYKNLAAESTSSRFASVSSEEAFMKDPVEKKGLLKWGARKFVEHKNFAYGDVTVYSVPVKGKIDKDRIRKALDKKFPRQSSYGQIRWFTGHAVLNEGDIGFKKTNIKNTVTVEEHYGIAD